MDKYEYDVAILNSAEQVKQFYKECSKTGFEPQGCVAFNMFLLVPYRYKVKSEK